MQGLVSEKKYLNAAIGGLALCITWIILYSVCAIFFWIAPEAMLSVTSRLFHGMSFSDMVEAGSSFGFKDYFLTVLIGSVYAFSAGFLYSVIHVSLAKDRISKA